MKRLDFVTTELKNRGLSDAEIEEFLTRFGNSLRVCKTNALMLKLINASVPVRKTQKA